MTTLPSAFKGLSSYAIASLTQAWANAEIFPKALFLGRLLHKRLEVLAPTEQNRVLGTCDKNRTIRINWQLIHAPLVVLEYVVAHEVVHLLHRNNFSIEQTSCNV